jgi:thiamine-phosphate pyrophosphorylase
MGLKHQAVSARKWRAAIRRIETHFPPALPALLFLTDPERTPDPVSIAARLPAGSGIVYRHFGADDRFEVAPKLAALARRRALKLLIAADPTLALEVGAHGVHWPEARLGEARKWRGRFSVQTASAHSRRATERAASIGVDAALVSTVFPSNSRSADAPMAPLAFTRLCQMVSLPLFALGGVTATNASQVAGAGGLAAIEGLS